MSLASTVRTPRGVSKRHDLPPYVSVVFFAVATGAVRSVSCPSITQSSWPAMSTTIRYPVARSARARAASYSVRSLFERKLRTSRTGAVTFDAEATKNLGDFQKLLDASTKFIPTWVKIAVAIALGLGTMVGWKRIVVTVGEKIGKTHLTYAQGACAEITAAATIAAADGYGLPVSTTHVLSSGIAGTMAANGSGLQWSTIRNIAMAWVLTLPIAMVLSGTLYLIFSRLF